MTGRFDGTASDVVLRRNDGVPAYNLAVVVDDAAAGIDVVARGDDLLPSTPSQVAIGRALGLPVPRYAHVPLVVGADGQRLTKRDGAITMSELDERGIDAEAVRIGLAASIGIVEAGERVPAGELISRFDVATLVRHADKPVRLADVLAVAEQSGAASRESPESPPRSW